MVLITGVQLEGGMGHEHIKWVQWCEQGESATYLATPEDMIELISKRNVVVSTATGAKVFVVPSQRPHLRTFDRGAWRNHLLLLPRFQVRETAPDGQQVHAAGRK